VGVDVRVAHYSRTAQLLAAANAANVSVSLTILPTLSFVGVCLPGFGPFSGVVGDAGQQAWVCSATSMAAGSGVWRPLNRTEAPLACAPCKPGTLCAGATTLGQIWPCPNGTFSAAAQSTACSNCPRCCPSCDRTTGRCLDDRVGCLIYDGISDVCWPPGAVQPGSRGCAVCAPQVSPSAWSVPCWITAAL
jgi:hypothetical protein